MDTAGERIYLAVDGDGVSTMVLTTRTYTADDLWQMPGDEPWELWDGELRQVPSAGGRASRIAGKVLTRLSIHLMSNDLGIVTGADGTYILFPDQRTAIVPDVAFVRWERLPNREVPDKYIPVPPDLAVEVQSPTDEPGDMTAKRALYARAGVPLLWWVDPAARTVTVHRPGQAPITLTEADTLDGADVLPGLSIPVAEIFV